MKVRNNVPYADFGLNSPKITFKFKDIIENGTISYSILPRELQLEVCIERKDNNYDETGTITIRIISKMNNYNQPPPIPQSYSQGLQMQFNNGPNPALLGNPQLGPFPRNNIPFINGPQLGSGPELGNGLELGDGPQLGFGMRMPNMSVHGSSPFAPPNFFRPI